MKKAYITPNTNVTEISACPLCSASNHSIIIIPSPGDGSGDNLFEGGDIRPFSPTPFDTSEGWNPSHSGELF